MLKPSQAGIVTLLDKYSVDAEAQERLFLVLSKHGWSVGYPLVAPVIGNLIKNFRHIHNPSAYVATSVMKADQKFCDEKLVLQGSNDTTAQ